MRHGPSARLVLAIASLGAAVAFVDATIVNIALPDIRQSFKGASISSLSWVLNAYNIVFAAFLVAAGRIADLLGRRRVFVFGLELFTGASLLCAIAPSVGTLIGFRVIQALGAAFLVPASLALVLNAFAPERRSHGVALLSAVGAAAAGLGPSLGGLLVAAANWRLVFLVNLPIGIAAALLARRKLIESRTPGRRQMPDLLGALLFAIAIGALVLGVVKGQDWGWGDSRILVAFATAVCAGVVFVWRCTWHRSPIIDLSLLRIRTFSAANAMTVVGAAGFYGYTLANVLFLTGVWGYSVLQAGLALTIGPLVAVAIAGPASRVVQRVGHRPVLVAGGVIWSLGLVWFVKRVGVTPKFVAEWLPGMVILGLGAGTLFPNLSGAAVASAPGESFATATGMNSVARQVGAALGVALIVAIIGTPTPLTALAAFQHAWTFGAVCLLVSGLGCVLVGKVDSEKAPGLSEAARVVLSADGDRPAVRPVPPRAPRAITVNAAQARATRPESPADFLARVPIFSGVGPDLREQLAVKSYTRRVPAGHWLFREGDEADAMFIVRAGRLEVVDEAAGTVIRELGRGDGAGELALLTGSLRSASVRAVRTSDVIAVEKDAFDEVVNSSPALSLALTRTLARQLRDTRAPVQVTRPRPTTVALVALSDGISLRRLADVVASELKTHLSLAVLSGEEVAAPAPGTEPATVYGPLIDGAESLHDLVLLAGG
ncbi:MAG: MDR family MFS transporter, partial [Solirubrobacteraceae bacterium]